MFVINWVQADAAKHDSALLRYHNIRSKIRQGLLGSLLQGGKEKCITLKRNIQNRFSATPSPPV
jgi:hypothetical protein